MIARIAPIILFGFVFMNLTTVPPSFAGQTDDDLLCDELKNLEKNLATLDRLVQQEAFAKALPHYLKIRKILRLNLYAKSAADWAAFAAELNEFANAVSQAYANHHVTANVQRIQLLIQGGAVCREKEASCYKLMQECMASAHNMDAAEECERKKRACESSR